MAKQRLPIRVMVAYSMRRLTWHRCDGKGMEDLQWKAFCAVWAFIGDAAAKAVV